MEIQWIPSAGTFNKSDFALQVSGIFFRRTVLKKFCINATHCKIQNKFPGQPTMIKNYKHIFWDWNGTILNDRWLCVDIMNGMLTRYNLPEIDEKTYQNLFDFPVIDYYARLGFDFSFHSFEKIGMEFIDHYKNRWQECSLHPQVEQVFLQIKQLGIKQSILTAAHSELVEQALTHYQLEPYFEQVVGLDHYYATSKIEIGLGYLQTLDVPGEEILMIGDTRHDFEVAQSIGIDCLLVTMGHHPLEKLIPLNTPTLSHYNELLKLPDLLD